jgi:hypothetical protein
VHELLGYATLHRRDRRLLCHYCNYAERVPTHCPKCQSEHIYFIGVGSEKAEEELHREIPKARIARLDRNTASAKRLGQATLRRSRGRPPTNTADNVVPIALPCQAKVIVNLQPEPGFRRNTEICSQPQGRIGHDGANAIHDCTDAVGRDVQIASQLVDAEPERFHEVFQEDLSWMDWML